MIDNTCGPSQSAGNEAPVLDNKVRYCRKALKGVSRTFALGIELLQEPLRDEIGIAYLVCRILDTIEDSTDLPAESRVDMLLQAEGEIFDPALYPARATAIEQLFDDPALQGADHELCRNTGTVLAALHELRPEAREAMEPPVREMARGMAATVRRELRGEGLHLETMEDLERYCYYVAGTVGQLLTSLYALDRPSIGPEVEAELRRHEVAFGLGLQVTNIIKGVTDDIGRGVSYLPLCLFRKAGITIDTLLSRPDDPRGREVVAGLASWTLDKLDEALEYTLAIPVQESDLRMFCGLPLAFAVRTLSLALRSSAVFSENVLKISRLEVAAIHRRMESILDDNDRIRELYREERALVPVSQP
jgi:farnesyl-diphosphate farnesyltransferase